MTLETRENNRIDSLTQARAGRMSRFGFLWLALPFFVLGWYLIHPFRPLKHPASPPAASISNPAAHPPLLEINFDSPAHLGGWKEHVFQGKSSYEIIAGENGNGFLRAASQNTSSAIFREVNIPAAQRPILSWEWKAVTFPGNKKNQRLAAKSDNDYAARVYVMFGKNNPWTADVIQYVWDDYFPEDARGQSPYSNRVKVLVVEHGSGQKPDGWVLEKRDLVQDYQMMFGKLPKENLRVVALMSDSDNTGTRSEAAFRKIKLERSLL